MIEFAAKDGTALPVPTGGLAANGELIYAIPAMIVTRANGRQEFLTLASDHDPRPGEWHDLGRGIALFPGVQISTTDWISVSATVVFGTLSSRVLDPSHPWEVQQHRFRGMSLAGELGYRTVQAGIGYSRIQFMTILYIIPIPAEISWGIHATVLHAISGGHGLRAGDNYAGVDGRVSAGLIRFTTGLYRRLGDEQSQGRRYLLRAGVGFGF